MAYVKNNWVDQNVERPKTYDFTTNSDGSVTLIDSFGLVTELGTPVNADNMNHIEEGIEAGSFTKYNSETTYQLNDLVTVIMDGKVSIYKSLIENNFENPLTEKTAWEEIKFAGGGGLEIGDIGTALFVDETKGLRRKLNGSILLINDNTQGFLNWLKTIIATAPSLSTTEENWQAEVTLSKLGQCGKFVINEEAGTIRLPKVVNINGLQDLNQAGVRLDESLPNIKGTVDEKGNQWISTEGCFELNAKSSTYGHATTTGSSERGFNFDASRSSSTYQDNAPVQQEAIQYPYFIQIATGAETEVNIVNTLETNIPYELFDERYSDHKLYNASWLLSNGQWNPKAQYTKQFEALQVEYNSEVEEGETVTLPSGGTYTKKGLSVKLSTETFNDYDFVLNLSDETFRLKLKTNMAGSKAIVGNGMAVGLTDGTHLAGLKHTSNDLAGRAGAYGVTLPQVVADQSGIFTSNAAIGITTDPVKSGMELADSNLYLYFYVGETLQNVNIVNVGRIEEKLNNFISRNDKELVASWLTPDWTSAIDITASIKNYTAPCIGWIVGAYENNADKDWFINGVIVAHSDSGSQGGHDSFIYWYVDKGDNVTFTGSSSGSHQNVSFVPAKGVNNV